MASLRAWAWRINGGPSSPGGPIAAREVERDDDAIALLQIGDGRADLFDDAHRFMADDVAGFHGRHKAIE